MPDANNGSGPLADSETDVEQDDLGYREREVASLVSCLQTGFTELAAWSLAGAGVEAPSAEVASRLDRMLDLVDECIALAGGREEMSAWCDRVRAAVNNN